MFRLILFVVVGVFVVVGGLAVALHHFFGWKGLMAFPFILIAFLWLLKFLIKHAFKRFALGLFGMKSKVLRGAKMNVHSMRSIPKPPERVREETEASHTAIEDQSEGVDDEDEEEAETRSEAPKDYVEVDVTISPKSASGDAIWEPSELMLASEKIKSLMDLEGKEIGTTHSVEIWNGTEFGPDDPGKYPGEQRLKIVFAVKAGATQGWLHYYNEPIGELKLPVGTIDI